MDRRSGGEASRVAADFGVYGASHPLQAPGEIQDLDSYVEVDQALLRRRLDVVGRWPWEIGIAWQQSGPLEGRRLVEDIAALRPRAVDVRCRQLDALSEFHPLAERGIEVRASHVLSGGGAPGYASLAAARLTIDLALHAPASCPDLIREIVVPALDGVHYPVRIALPVEPGNLDALDHALALIRERGSSVGAAILTTPARFPGQAKDYQELTAILLRYAPALRISLRNDYRYARLHLYYRLPMLRMFIEPDGAVLPLASSPIRLGSLESDSLPDIWETNRKSFWQRADVLERFERWYRLADMMGEPA